MYKRKFYRQKHNRLDLDPTTIITPEAMPEYGYGGASRDKLEGSFPVVRKRIEDFFEKLEKQGVGTAACVHTATYGGSEGEDGKEIDFFDDEDRLEKAKIYLQPGEKPPEGVQVLRGARGGLFYISGQAGPKPKEEPSGVKGSIPVDILGKIKGSGAVWRYPKEDNDWHDFGDGDFQHSFRNGSINYNSDTKEWSLRLFSREKGSRELKLGKSPSSFLDSKDAKRKQKTKKVENAIEKDFPSFFKFSQGADFSRVNLNSSKTRDFLRTMDDYASFAEGTASEMTRRRLFGLATKIFDGIEKRLEEYPEGIGAGEEKFYMLYLRNQDHPGIIIDGAFNMYHNDPESPEFVGLFSPSDEQLDAHSNIAVVTLDNLFEGKERMETLEKSTLIEKAKIYLQSGEKPPEGIQVLRGPRGGLYYESEQGAEPSLTQESLKQKGWYLKDYQKNWLSEGQATLEEIPIDKCQQWEYDPPLVESNKRVQEMALSLKQGHRLSVIETYRSKDGGYVVADGQHRLMAYKALGHKTIPAMVTAEEKVKEAPHKLEESLSGKIAQKAARLEPKFSGIITNIAEATGGDLYKFEFRQKDQQGIDRKIKEIKESHPELSEEEAAEQVTDYLRYTIVYSCEEYGKKVISAQNKLKEMGFDFYDHKLRKYFGEGPYKGYNTVMQDSEGNVFELQFHTHKSLERLDKVRPLYEKFRVEQDNHAKGQLYLQMMQGWEGFVLPSDIEMLAGVMM